MVTNNPPPGSLGATFLKYKQIQKNADENDLKVVGIERSQPELIKKGCVNQTMPDWVKCNYHPGAAMTDVQGVQQRFVELTADLSNFLKRQEAEEGARPSSPSPRSEKTREQVVVKIHESDNNFEMQHVKKTTSNSQGKVNSRK